jgi:hypothetical protein
MPEFKRKNRMISLRISEEEYESLKHVHISQGVRSLAEVVRLAIERVTSADAHPENHTLESRFTALDGKVAGLQSELARLSRVVEEELVPARKD